VEVFVHLFHAFVELGEYLPHLFGCCQLLRNGGDGHCLFFYFVFFILENLGRSRDLFVGEMLFCGPPVADDAAAATVGGVIS